jgi:hypothetical protein
MPSAAKHVINICREETTVLLTLHSGSTLSTPLFQQRLCLTQGAEWPAELSLNGRPWEARAVQWARDGHEKT